MLRFKQFLIEEDKSMGAVSQGYHGILNNLKSLTGLNPDEMKRIEQLQKDLSTATENRNREQLTRIFSQIDDFNQSEEMNNLNSQNLKLRGYKSQELGSMKIDTKLRPELQQKQKEIRTAAFRERGFVPPADDVIDTVSFHGSSPTLDTLASRVAAGEPNAMDLRIDTKGNLRPNLKSIGAAGAGVVGALASGMISQGAGAVLDVMSGILTTPPPKVRMEVEKDLNTDVGLGFDYQDGELVASPEGFAAVNKRNQARKTGEKVSGPQTAFTTDLYR